MPSHDHERRRFLARTATLGWVLAVPAALVDCGREDAGRTTESASAGERSAPEGASSAAERTASGSGDSGAATASSTGGSEESPARPTGYTTDSTAAAGETGDGTTKLTKEQAGYQQQPNETQRCSNCQHFIAESNTCKIVEGQIDPEGWCRLWVAKT